MWQVTDAQLLTLAVAMILPLSMLLYSNSRITEAKETLRAEIAASKHALRSEISESAHALRMEMQALRAEMQAQRSEMQLGFERILNKLDHLAGEVATLKEQMPAHLRDYHNVT